MLSSSYVATTVVEFGNHELLCPCNKTDFNYVMFYNALYAYVI